ncbi:prenyltransferase [Pelagibaculum spongiae]|uniref:Prenyltransferase n=1 Tax=Pelagibaculum spongiae TaxID=2080658 RepID=A0A2V1GYV3_9GAMM|nr:prenyltransferase [Pelagibaculum spongiae]PVZ70537.1 prenyltransferase [Pelagibaculum spongiae]
MDKYLLKRAARPFSLIVALVVCGLGIRLSWQAGYQDIGRALAIFFAAVIAQIGVNLINDHRDIETHSLTDQAKHAIKRNLWLGVGCFVAAAGLGLWLVWLTGWQLFLLGVIGLAGGWFYTAKPIAYKHRGLGLVGVFIFTGVMMVYGAWMAMGGDWSLRVFLLSLPVSLIASLILLANEIRDYEDDKTKQIGTLSVRIGLLPARILFVILAIAPFAAVFSLYELIPRFWMVLPALILLIAPLKEFLKPEGQRQKLPPVTGRFFAGFGLLYWFAV